jgi:hypothetical protein
MNSRIIALGGLLTFAGLAAATPVVQVHLPVHYDLYYVGDLDPQGALRGVGQEITVEVSNLLLGTYNLQVDLLFGGMVLADGEVENFQVQESHWGPWSLADIRGNRVPGGSGRGSFNDEFLAQISGNALPSGVYTVEATITPVMPAGSSVTTTATFTINDPRQVDLQTPWNDASLFTTEPSFSWSGRANTYHIVVCEFDAERHGSPQDALESTPLWSATLDGRTSVVYGEGGARPLVPGRRYVWQVEAVLNTTSGRREFASEARTFTVRADGGPNPQQLANLLGGLTPSQLAGLADLLGNFQLSGTILVDGRPVSLEEFQQLLGRIASGELNIASIRIE